MIKRPEQVYVEFYIKFTITHTCLEMTIYWKFLQLKPADYI